MISLSRSRVRCCALSLLVILLAVFPRSPLRAAPLPTPAKSSFTLFESGPVRPLALSPSGETLFVCNIPDNRLEVFRVTASGLVHRGSIPVGLEPVAVAARSDREAWVVNHLSDSVSVVALEADRRRHPVAANPRLGRVLRTLLVGDEPRDIVFGGPHRNRAFITTAHRGQNAPYGPEEFVTPGRDRADVWVFDADAVVASRQSAARIALITLFTDTPRALAVSPDGRRVYAAGFHTGNQTTALNEAFVPDDAASDPEGLALPEPRTNIDGVVQPQVGLIVRFANGHWLDEDGKIWDSKLRLSLPDKDVFAIDAERDPPALVEGAEGFFSGVGTVLFNMVFNPVSGRVYVSNTEANNAQRFEGAGEHLAKFGKKTLRGHLHESRITVLGGTPRVQPIHLNKHIDYGQCCAAPDSLENRRSVAMPLDMAVTPDGSKLYVAAFGSSEVAVYDTAQLESDSFVPDVAQQIAISGGGPAGLALEPSGERLFVFTRFDNGIAIVDTRSQREIGRVKLFNPEPESVVKGRPFLYDAALTSSHGDSACGSCHVFGDLDSLAWDLGDPDERALSIGPERPNPANPVLFSDVFALRPQPLGLSPDFAPLKGPMTTQSLRGLDNHGPMHWRGDRLNNTDPSAQPNGGMFDERAAFLKFNPAFKNLNGRDAELSEEQMHAFLEFVLQLSYPPNPIRNLDNSLTPDQQAGLAFFFGPTSDTFLNCNGCHTLDFAANTADGAARSGQFGTDGRLSFDGEPQIFKIPHLRNQYQKIGMFGNMAGGNAVPGELTGESNAHLGDQVRGFGFLHDGSVDTVHRFLSALVFARKPLNPQGYEVSPAGNTLRRQTEQMVLAFDSDLLPIVGQQLTLTAGSGAAERERLRLLVARAEAGDCDLVAKRAGRGFVYALQQGFVPDRAGRPALSVRSLQTLARVRGLETTLTCVPPGSGVRIGIDRDEDGIRDGDESRGPGGER